MGAVVNNGNGAMLVALAVDAGLPVSVEHRDVVVRIPAIATTTVPRYTAHD